MTPTDRYNLRRRERKPDVNTPVAAATRSMSAEVDDIPHSSFSSYSFALKHGHPTSITTTRLRTKTHSLKAPAEADGRRQILEINNASSRVFPLPPRPSPALSLDSSTSSTRLQRSPSQQLPIATRSTWRRTPIVEIRTRPATRSRLQTPSFSLPLPPRPLPSRSRLPTPSNRSNASSLPIPSTPLGLAPLAARSPPPTDSLRSHLLPHQSSRRPIQRTETTRRRC